jgi:hypothetical protein
LDIPRPVPPDAVIGQKLLGLFKDFWRDDGFVGPIIEFPRILHLPHIEAVVQEIPDVPFIESFASVHYSGPIGMSFGPETSLICCLGYVYQRTLFQIKAKDLVNDLGFGLIDNQGLLFLVHIVT